MSGTSGEAIVAVVRQVLSVRGPMAEDDLLGVLDADGIDLGPDPDVMLADVLDQDGIVKLLARCGAARIGRLWRLRRGRRVESWRGNAHRR